MDEIDVSLPNTVKNFINQLLRIMGTLIIVTYTFPSIIFTIIPLTFGVMWTLKSYIVTSRVLRRSAAATMAIVNAQMSETILGVATIRTYKLQTPVLYSIFIYFFFPIMGAIFFISDDRRMHESHR